MIGTQRSEPARELEFVFSTGGIRIEGCTCGGVIRVSDPPEPDRIFHAVRTHQQTLGHQAWRRAGMPGLGR